MLTVLCDYKRVIHHEYMVKGTRMNTKTYVKNLKTG
jgi:hypothetical protein